MKRFYPQAKNKKSKSHRGCRDSFAFEAIQLKAKFALANLSNPRNNAFNLKSGYLRKKNSLNGYF